MQFNYHNFKEAFTTEHTLLSLSIRWGFIVILVGVAIGSVSALFLHLLELVTEIRIEHAYLLYGLPIGGLSIGLLYHYYGGETNKGNNLIIEEYHTPDKTIPFKMFPLVLIGTLTTHLFGGSAGREGTAIQMGGTIADQFTSLFKLDPEDRDTLLLMGISAGFASVFGTPIAGIFFAFELMLFKKFNIKAILPVIITAYISHYICILWGINHTVYTVDALASYSLTTLASIALAGILFGITAYLFIHSTKLWNKLFTNFITYPPLRPFIGAIIFIILILLIGSTDYLGLGVPIIVNSFTYQMVWNVFLLKIFFTSLTLGAGFKGGEVTPLFFIGATLGSFLSIYLDLPVSLMAALGFVAVFSGATKTPIACTFMGMELFGIEYAILLALTCFIAYRVSGKQSVYNSQYKNNNKTSVSKLN
ncbi:chloride channel protein [Myroides sp. M-43]|uniref:chloride channel protein n=1 Tax=Myroides oncorhynchi TaxID=2893756 RepID=UPI001E3E5840|nr:chloride channel protein [Myroides oncorhynchi]MCC9043011.1 chloride channel protein [Myroides oncorhynchi]